MGNITPIPTRYKDYRFRSRLEARWAVFLDYLQLEWDYEREGYTLHDGTCYLPDFWIPRWKMFIEVKGTEPTKEELNKAGQLSISGLTRTLLAWGNLWQEEQRMLLFTGQTEPVTFYDSFLNCSDCDAVILSYAQSDHCTWLHLDKCRCLKCNGQCTCENPGDHVPFPEHGRVYEAYKFARSARFEHGETPVVPVL